MKTGRKTTIYALMFIGAFLIATGSCKKETNNNNNNPTTVTDIDGNVYHMVTIGAQVWLIENLKTTRYRNGDTLPYVADNTAWENLTTGGYCSCNNDPANNATCGRLYNWYAIADARGIAPTGWHTATDADWYTLVDYLGGYEIAGAKLKEAGTTHWSNPNNGAINETGFTALPGGVRDFDGTFSYFRISGIYWTSTQAAPGDAWSRFLDIGNIEAIRDNNDKRDGLSVRCVKD